MTEVIESRCMFTHGLETKRNEEKIVECDAKTDEFLQMKVFNRDLRVSDSEMHAMLKKANLTGHGYKKEVTMKQRQNADNGELEYEKAYFFYKIVNCTQITAVEEELQNFLPGVLGRDEENTFKKEVKFRHLDNMGMCRAGLEVHFKESQGCSAGQSVSRRRKRHFDCWFCSGCVVGEKIPKHAATRANQSKIPKHKAIAANQSKIPKHTATAANQTTLSST